MKKTILILAAIALVLIVAVGGVIWYLISTIGQAGGPPEEKPVETFLKEQWPEYQLEEWDSAAGSLRLSRRMGLTYEQLEKYGNQPEMNELVRGHLATMEQIAVGMLHQCGVEPAQMEIIGLSSDGKTAYTVSRDGTISTCWSTDAPAS